MSDLLIGRDALAQKLGRQLLDSPGLITLLGPAGMGKTRLARELRQRHGAEFGGGDHYIDLTDVRSAEAFVGAVAAGVDLRLPEGQGIESDVERVESRLRSAGRMLLVLDNFEQLVEAGAQLLARWVGASRSIRVLVTSREALGISAERRVELPPLSPEDGARLLLSRAAQIRSEADPDDPEQQALASEIATELDGIPLAIELAAARAGVLGLRELRARLPERLDVLRSPRRDRPARQSTLRAAIDGSWELLDAAGQRALCWLSVFRGGFASPMAERVLGDGALDLLEALRDRSLLRSFEPEALPGELRFGLYESIRAYAWEQLEASGDRDAACRAHAALLADLGEEMVSPYQSSPAGARLDLEHDNLVAAWTWALEHDLHLAARLCLTLDAMMLQRGPFSLRFELVERTAATVDSAAAPLADLRLAGRLKLARAGIEYDRGHQVEARTALREALPKARAAQDDTLCARVLGMIGVVSTSMGDWETAEDALREGLALLGSDGDRLRRGQLLNNLALIVAGQDRDEEAADALREAVALLEAEGAIGPVGASRINLGQVLHSGGHLDEGRRELVVGTEYCEKAGDRFYSCFGYLSQAWLAFDTGALSDATAWSERASAEAKALGDMRLEGLAAATAGMLEAHGDRLSAARDAFAHSDRLLTEAGDRSCLDVLLLLRGHGDLAAARAGDAAGFKRAQGRLADLGGEGEEVPTMTPETCVARRLLLLALEAAEPARDTEVLRVELSARRFVLGQSDPVDLERRPVLGRVLEALVSARLDRPGEYLSREALLAQGWPGENPNPASGANRVYVALSTLRKLGLGEIIEKGEGGYRLSPTTPVERA